MIRRLGLLGARIVPRNPWLLIPAAGLVVALLTILFVETTTHGASNVLFSGQDALPGLVDNAGTWSIGALLMVLLCKGLAWSACLGSFRGGPTFPAIFLGAAGGVAASHLPGLSLTPAVAVGMGVMVVAFLKLPLSAVVIATSLTATAGLRGRSAHHRRRGDRVPGHARARRAPRHGWSGAGRRPRGYGLTTSTT